MPTTSRFSTFSPTALAMSSAFWRSCWLSTEPSRKMVEPTTLTCTLRRPAFWKAALRFCATSFLALGATFTKLFTFG